MTADVTIVVATYNRPAMLEVLLHSILAARAMCPSVSTRVVVVDDHSDDEAALYVAKAIGVDYLRLPENRGVAGALAAGFEQVDSPLYALWGDDDYMLPRWLLLHLRELEQGHDVVAGSYWLADAELRQTRQVTLPVATFADLSRGKVTCNDGSLVRRDALGDVVFRPERERAMMMTFWLALAAAGRSFSVVQEPTWLYRRHGANLSNHRSAHDDALRAAAIAEYR